MAYEPAESWLTLATSSDDQDSGALCRKPFAALLARARGILGG